MGNYDLRPMEPIPWPEPFNEAGWTFQVKWDGVRMLALWSSQQVQLINRKGVSRTQQYPEIAQLVTAFPAGTVVDGELVVLAAGKPQFELILKREQRRQAAAIRRGMEEFPVTYAVFDMLYWQGKDIRPWPLEARQATLAENWPDGCSQLHLVENFPEGKALYKAVGQLGWEGIVCKRLQSAYRPGKKSTDWRKVKHWRQLDCAVGGYTLRNGLPSALLLGLYGEKGLVYVGRAASGLRAADWEALQGFLQAAEREQSPFISTVPAEGDRRICWVEPYLAAKIRFQEWSADGKLRAPVVLGFLPVTKADCSLPPGEVPPWLH